MSAPADIECPRCHRISFAWESDHSCQECRWVIRPSEVAEPYGYDVLIEKRESNGTATTLERHYKGNEATARKRARPIGRVLAVVPLNERSWIAAYGEGRL